jgi:hypothetical protein
VPTAVPSRVEIDFPAELPTDSAEIFAVWSDLPRAIRTGILTMVQTSI